MSAFQELAEQLADRYPPQAEVRRILTYAGVPFLQIDLSGSPATMWFSVLDYALQREHIRKIADVVLQENPDLKDLVQRFLQEQKQNKPPDVQPPDVQPPGDGGLRRWIPAVVGLAIATLVVVGYSHFLFPWPFHSGQRNQDQLRQQEQRLQQLEAKMEALKQQLAQGPADPSSLPGASLAADKDAVAKVLPRISDDAIALITSFEMGNRVGQNLNPVWFGGEGGISIGIGYDLGFAASQKFVDDWGAYLPKEAVAALQAVVGKRGNDAREALHSVAGIVIPWKTSVQVLLRSVIGPFALEVQRQLPNSDGLHPDSFGALVSLAFNRGTSFGKQGDRYREMRSIRDLISLGNYAAVPDQLRSMGRLWPTMPGLIRRREAEAELFEKGLLLASIAASR